MISKHELQNIISGTGRSAKSNFIQTAANFLRKGEETGGEIKTIRQSKAEEEQDLIKWSDKNGFWIAGVDESRYLTRGAEQKIYLGNDNSFVIKLNDAIFYQCWSDYFQSLLIHNYFFPNTSYQLLGFYFAEGIFYAAVKQRYIEMNDVTDLETVNEFLQSNGFVRVRNQDFLNAELGLILEDIHDENVLTNNGVLFFIDTVFYLK